MQHSSLGLQIPADGFICSDIEEVSGTGHYSPVSPPNSMGAANMYGIEFAQTGGPEWKWEQQYAECPAFATSTSRSPPFPCTRNNSLTPKEIKGTPI